MGRNKRNKNISTKKAIYVLIIFAIITVFTYWNEKNDYNLKNIQNSENTFGKATYSTLQDIPEYNGKYV